MARQRLWLVALALVVALGAATHPARVAAELRARATDLGKPGRDA